MVIVGEVVVVVVVMVVMVVALVVMAAGTRKFRTHILRIWWYCFLHVTPPGGVRAEPDRRTNMSQTIRGQSNHCNNYSNLS